MARRRTLGYIQNEWTCPNCNTRNKGGSKTCENCGAPQPENVQFELPSDQQFVKDEKQIQAAQAGADIHCGFCGTRNPATATTCSQCGADLKEGRARQTGKVMQAPPPQPKVVTCTRCGTENPGATSTCSNCGAPLPKVVPTRPMQTTTQSGMPAAPPNAKTSNKRNLFIIAAVFVCLAVVCVGVLASLLPSATVEATVVDVHWQTNVPVQEIQPVRYTDERRSPPSDAYNVFCRDESRDVCEQKTIDRGNGYSEVVEECHTETETYCSYTVDEWQTIQTYTLEGNDLRPVYDSPSYSSNQRLGTQSEELTVTFSTEKGEKTYSPDTVSEFQQFTIGSTWTLKLNALGGIVSVEP
ncbi:MAG: zinc ribbon domain-containing protein [Chloroflexi bacterium]|nr:zinc ribbon domain-containing protein [Chloroflexota bacterium]